MMLAKQQARFAAIFGAVGIIIAVCIAAPSAAASLRILVPLNKGFQEFVRWESASGRPITANSSITFSGFAIEVFRECMHHLNYTDNDYQLIGYGDGINDPSYDGLVQSLAGWDADGVVADGVVADLTMTRDRFDLVDFTQPYLESHLDMIVPFPSSEIPGWRIYIAPFTWDLWCTILIAFFVVVIGMLVIKGDISNCADFPRLVMESFWLTSVGLVTSHIIGGDDEKSIPVRILAFNWMLLVLVLTSCYTSSLTSVLQQQQHKIPTIRSFLDLQKSRLSIGCQQGSFTTGYLTDNLFIAPDRLVALVTQDDYDKALKSGRVAAIIDESPYIETFLTKSGCKYKTADSNIAYFGGLAFAFRKNSSLTNDISLSIVSLEQTGVLQRLKDNWLGSGQCALATTSDNILSLKSYLTFFVFLAFIFSMVVTLWIFRHLMTERGNRTN